ncbi:hypothetical protein [Haloarchaeobius sp. DFWS5]|uniref:hypothetical protein n=1 Tax=Haloarchaeobius sp. DFWS5 TaxID=3446114 RepID=UPI003EBC1044
MSGDGDTRDSDAHEDERRDERAVLDRHVDRAFTCTTCGYTNHHEVPLLQGRIEATCLNCGDWTIQFADESEVAAAARAAAEELAGETLTERQALVYVLRETMDVDRQTAADVLDSSPSNVDNLQRRAAEKVKDARRIVDGLDELDELDSE